MTKIPKFFFFLCIISICAYSAEKEKSETHSKKIETNQQTSDSLTVLHPKSTTLGIVLGVDPFPGDALIYSGKPWQGIADIGLGLVGVSLIVGGSVYQTLGAVGEIFSFGQCEGDCGVSSGGYLITSGIVVYVVSLVWDAISGIKGVYDHNEKISQKQRLAYSIQNPNLPFRGIFLFQF